MRTTSAGSIPNAQLRQAFLDSGLSASEVAGRVSWMRSRDSNADCTKVRRLLGLTEYVRQHKGREVRILKTEISQDDAVALGEVFGLDPWELGL